MAFIHGIVSMKFNATYWTWMRLVPVRLCLSRHDDAWLPLTDKASHHFHEFSVDCKPQTAALSFPAKTLSHLRKAEKDIAARMAYALFTSPDRATALLAAANVQPTL